MIMMMNFFRAVPPELEDAAVIDGATMFQILRKNLSATMQTFYRGNCPVFHCGQLEWLDGWLPVYEQRQITIRFRRIWLPC